MASKKSLFERISVQDDYFGFVWVVTRTVLLCVCIHLYFSFSSTKNNLKEQLINLSHSAKAGIAEELKRYEETFLKAEKKIFEYKSSVREKYIENIQDIIEDTQKNQGIVLSWVDNTHLFPHSDYHMLDSKTLYLEMKKAFETHSRKIFISPIRSLDAREGGTGVFRIIYPVLKDNVIVGFLFSKIKINRILRNAAKEFGGGDSILIIRDKNGRIVNRFPAYSTHNNFFEQDSYVTEPYYRDVHKIPNLDLILVVGTYERVITKNFFENTIPGILKLFLIGFIVLLVLYVYRRRLLGNIKDLSLRLGNTFDHNTFFEPPKFSTKGLQDLSNTLGLLTSRFIQREKDYKALDLENEKILALYRSIQEKNRTLIEDKKRLDFEMETLSASESEKSVLKKELLLKSDVHLNTIEGHINIIQNILEKNGNQSSLIEEQGKMLVLIKQEILKLKTMTLDSLEFVDTDVNEIIKSSIGINSNLSYKNETKVEFSKARGVRKVSADSVSLKQAFAALIEQSIHFTPKGVIKIETSVDKTQNLFCIVLYDNGFGLKQKDMERIATYFDQSGDSKLSANFDFIERVIAMHRGVVEEEQVPGDGRKITIKLPLKSSKNNKTEKSNIYYLERVK